MTGTELKKLFDFVAAKTPSQDKFEMNGWEVLASQDKVQELRIRYVGSTTKLVLVEWTDEGRTETVLFSAQADDNDYDWEESHQL